MALSNRHNVLWKSLAFVVLLVIPMPVWAVQGSEKKREENPSPPRHEVQREEHHVATPKAQQPKPVPQYQQSVQQHKVVTPREQQPRTLPQYQQSGQQHQVVTPKAQQPRTLPQYQQSGQQHQIITPKAQQPRTLPQYQQSGQRYQTQQQAQPRMLTPAQSRQQMQDLNRNRGSMSGINRNPLPQGQVTTRADGSRTILASGGRQFQVRPNGTVAHVSLAGGRTASFRPDGRVSAIQAGGMQINHGLRGERRIVTVRPDHSRVVSMGPHHGYVERPYMTRGGRTYVQRTYVVNNVTYTRVYRSYYYRGVPYYAYVPPYYYHPRFYAWVYSPWRVPVYYRWPWFAAPPPWYAYYGGYFAPLPMYPTAALWLTDFLLAEDLRLAYEARRDAEANAAAQAYQPPPPAAEGQGYTSQITPEMRQAIAEEVRAQLAAEQQRAATPPQPAPSSPEAPPAALDPARRLFVVPGNLDVATVEGQECELTAGDIITRLDDTPDSNNKVRVSASSSKRGDCAVGSTLMADVNELQEMQNQFGEKVDSGLNALSNSSGKGGLPPAPDTGTSPGEVPAPRPDANVGGALQAQQLQANQAESQVVQEAAPGAQN